MLCLTGASAPVLRSGRVHRAPAQMSPAIAAARTATKATARTRPRDAAEAVAPAEARTSAADDCRGPARRRFVMAERDVAVRPVQRLSSVAGRPPGPAAGRRVAAARPGVPPTRLAYRRPPTVRSRDRSGPQAFEDLRPPRVGSTRRPRRRARSAPAPRREPPALRRCRESAERRLATREALPPAVRGAHTA